MPAVIGFAVVVLAATGRAACPDNRCTFLYDGVRQVVGDCFVSADARLRVRVERRDYPAFDATWWWQTFENPSSEESGLISEIADADISVGLPPENPLRKYPENSKPGDRAVRAMNGCVFSDHYKERDDLSAAEFRWVDHYFRGVRNPRFAFESFGGRSSDRQAPFFVVSQDGEGAYIAIGWSGDWKASFTNRADGVGVRTGLKRTAFRLHPGEKVRTTSTLVMRVKSGEDGANKFRRLLREHFSPKYQGREQRVFGVECWGSVSSGEMMRQIEEARTHGLTFEQFWVDAGWYGSCNGSGNEAGSDWYARAGDWTPNLRLHPGGLRDVATAARAAGMGMMLWFEPERVGPKSDYRQQNPGRLLSIRDRDGNGVLWLGDDVVRQEMTSLILKTTETLGLSCYRQDFNMEPAESFAAADAGEKDRVGISEIKHICGLYAMLDELRRKRPELVIDNCASGGRRMDIEMLRRSIPIFPSDYLCGSNPNADVIQSQKAGLARIIPTAGAAVKSADLYSLRSAYQPSFGMSFRYAVKRNLDAADWKTLKKSHDEYLRIRDLLSTDFYLHGSRTEDPSSWFIVQYHDPASGRGVVQAFRRELSPSASASFRLKGLPTDADVEFEDLDSGTVRQGGPEVTVTLAAPRSSALWMYRVK